MINMMLWQQNYCTHSVFKQRINHFKVRSGCSIMPKRTKSLSKDVSSHVDKRSKMVDDKLTNASTIVKQLYDSASIDITESKVTFFASLILRVAQEQSEKLCDACDMAALMATLSLKKRTDKTAQDKLGEWGGCIPHYAFFFVHKNRK